MEQRSMDENDVGEMASESEAEEKWRMIEEIWDRADEDERDRKERERQRNKREEDTGKSVRSRRWEEKVVERTRLTEEERSSVVKVLERNKAQRAVAVAFPHRRTTSKRDGIQFVVYNPTAHGRDAQFVPKLRTEWKADDEGNVGLHSLTRTQWFSVQYPFLGHAPTSDCRLTGPLESLNVDRAKEVNISRWERERECSGKPRNEQYERGRGTTHYEGVIADETVVSSGSQLVCDQPCSTSDDSQQRADAIWKKTESENSDCSGSVCEADTRIATPELVFSPPKRWIEESPLSPDGKSPNPLAAIDPSRWVPLTPERQDPEETDGPNTPNAVLDRITDEHELPPKDVYSEDPTPSLCGSSLANANCLSLELGSSTSHEATGRVRNESTEGYWLSDDVEKLQSWALLEDALIDFINVMKEHKRFGGNTWLLQSRPFRAPYTFPYRGCRTRSIAGERCARNARAAFHGLIALARTYVEAYRAHYSLASMQTTLDGNYGLELNGLEHAGNGSSMRMAQVDFAWTRYINTQCPRIPIQWISSVLATAIGTDSPGRVGCFVDLRDVYVLDVVLYHISIGMPAYIVCSADVQWMNSLDMQDRQRALSLLLRESEVPGFYSTILLSGQQTGADEVDSESTAMDSAFTANDDGTAIAGGTASNETSNTVEVGAQCGGTSLGVNVKSSPSLLMLEHQSALDVLVSTESAKERLVRQSREQGSANQVAPSNSHKSARCYVWENDVNGQLRRKRVAGEDLALIWPRYNRFSRKYLSVWHEWDLWHGYDRKPDGTYPAHDADEDFYDIALTYAEPDLPDGMKCEPFQLGAPAIVPHSLDPEVYQRQIEADARRVGRLMALREMKAQHGASNLAERARNYFGLTVGAACVMRTRPKDGDIRLTIIKMFEVPEWQDKVPSHMLVNVHRLVQDIECAGGCPTNLDVRLTDMHPNSPHYVARRNGDKVRIEIRTVIAPAQLSEHIPPTKKRKSTSTLYFIRPVGLELPFVLAVTDPLAALRALRSVEPFHCLLHEFLTTGVCLHLLRSTVSDRTTINMPRPLPILRTDKIENCDYSLYKLRLRAMLQVNHRLRLAALKEGGIVWRLVIQFVDVRETLDAISEEASAPAMGGASIANMPPTFDDDLTAEEERTVCGVYDSSTTASVGDNTMWSWWPRPSIWAQSSVCAGQWTMYNENWFLSRVAKLEGGNVGGELKTSNQWRQVLEGQKKRGGRFIKITRDVAAQVLQSI